MSTLKIKRSAFLLCATWFWLATTQAADIEVGQYKKAFINNGQKINTLKIKAGDTIHFKNNDAFFHNIFSLSDAETFDLGSFPKGESRLMTFSNKGTVEIECAVHPQMLLKIEVE